MMRCGRIRETSAMSQSAHLKHAPSNPALPSAAVVVVAEYVAESAVNTDPDPAAANAAYTSAPAVDVAAAVAVAGSSHSHDDTPSAAAGTPSHSPT